MLLPRFSSAERAAAKASVRLYAEHSSVRGTATRASDVSGEVLDEVVELSVMQAPGEAVSFWNAYAQFQFVLGGHPHTSWTLQAGKGSTFYPQEL